MPLRSYDQTCSIARTLELIGERWTLLIIRELMMGSSHFNALRRGVPKMSPALLSKRLRSLTRSGLVTHTDGVYTLTPSGADLFDVVQGIGLWGLKWVPELGEEDLDPHLLMWDMRRTVPADTWPDSRTVIAFELTDVTPKAASWWLCVSGGEVDVCDYDPGFDVTVTVTTDLRTLTEIWRGDVSWQQAIKDEQLELAGSRTAVKALPTWMGQMQLASVPRLDSQLAYSR